MKVLAGLILLVLPVTIMAQPPAIHKATTHYINNHVRLVIPSKHRYRAGFPDGESPASIACIYGLTTQVAGCPIATTSALPTGGWGTIALVDAYRPVNNIANDLVTFSNEFGLPAPGSAGSGTFTISQPQGEPAVDPDPDVDNWSLEATLDVEWAHAMAPAANIILVEALDASDNLFSAAYSAGEEVAEAGGGEVSMSWGGSEFSTETDFDELYFTGNAVVYLASTGDYSAPVEYPAASPLVIAVGGTTLERDDNGNFLDEVAWSGTPGSSGGGGGPSMYERRPSYQNIIQSQVGLMRGTPDVAFDAATPVAIYQDGEPCFGWCEVIGTSVSSPSFAGVINSADALRPSSQRATSTAQELTRIYSSYIKGYPQYWHDIVSGNNGYPALPGYDFTTGIGTPNGYNGK